MRTALSVLFLALLAMSASAQQTPGSQSTNPVYLLIDASGSMRGDNQKDALDILRAESLPRGQWISVNYFGAKSDDPSRADRCADNILPSNSIIRESDVPPFPELGGSIEKTAIGTALRSILSAAGDQPKVILITDGQEECNADFNVIRTEYPHAEIKVLLVGSAQNSALKLLEIKPALSSAVAAARIPPASDPKNELTIGSENIDEGQSDDAADDKTTITFWNSLPWAALATLFAASFIMLGSSFSDAHRDLDKRFQKLSEDAEKGTYVGSNDLKPKTNSAAFVFVAAFVVSLIVLWGPESFVGFARTGAASALNTEFGSAVFLAALMSLGVFAGSQYWRYTELRRAYRVASNEAERIKKAKADELDRLRKARAEQDMARLAELYESHRARFSDREYSFEKYLTRGEGLSANSELLARLVSLLKFLAAGPSLTREKISAGEVDRIAKFNWFFADRTPTGLVGFIPRTRLPEAIQKSAIAFFYPDQAQTVEQQHDALKKLLKEIELLATQHSSGT
ncbi:MAG TPA: hypothetical protein VGO52_03880 [Hyphomonadaceae bacterium]|jgi:hypothetical protein|nr:hypothetical protein [Hyphomonadaceae bacterium]